jgi:hypothetical protein
MASKADVEHENATTNRRQGSRVDYGRRAKKSTSRFLAATVDDPREGSEDTSLFDDGGTRQRAQDERSFVRHGRSGGCLEMMMTMQSKQ